MEHQQGREADAVAETSRRDDFAGTEEDGGQGSGGEGGGREGCLIVEGFNGRESEAGMGRWPLVVLDYGHSSITDIGFWYLGKGSGAFTFGIPLGKNANISTTIPLVADNFSVHRCPLLTLPASAVEVGYIFICLKRSSKLVVV